MEVKSLRLVNFRNYEDETLDFCPGTNFIFGDNAQGKTNLLEAVCMFSRGRSKRAKSDGELVRFGEKKYTLEMTFCDMQRSYNASITSGTDGKKSIKINNVPIKKLSQLMSYFHAVMFSPNELETVKGSPAVRRRFADEAISLLSPKYMAQLSRYYKILEEKNGLLKLLRSRGVRDDPTLSVWNEQLAAAGCEIAEKRCAFAETIGKKAAEIQKEISGELLEIAYKPSIPPSAFFETLEKNRRREAELGSSLLGIQRDDIKILISGKEARLFASQGQQRTAVLALKLAQTEYIYEETGEYPAILLDDIMSELDSNRRSYLAGKIKGKQVFITTTDAEASSDGDTKYYKISNGRAELCSFT